MNAKQVIGGLLFLVGVAGLGVAGYRIFEEPERAAPQQPSPPDEGAEAAPAPSRAVVYYFHTNKRCATCNKIEALTKSTLEESFATEILAKELELRTVNIDEPIHEHYRGDFLLDFGTVVIESRLPGDNGRYQRLDDVWKLHGDEELFRSYLEQNITEFLAAKDG